MAKSQKAYNNILTFDTFEDYFSMLRGVRVLSSPNLLTIFLIASIFGGLAFLYSFFGFFSNETTPRFDTFGSLTPQEIGGHFLFGYMVALPSRNPKIGLLAGLMALTLDADHLFNAAGFDVQGRMSHSISFAILASVSIGIMAREIYRKIPLRDITTMRSVLRSSNKIENSRHNSLLPSGRKRIFSQFLIIALAAYMSHIAYDVFVDTHTNFPLLAPFSFSDFFIPQIYAIPIEGAAILLVYLVYSATNKRTYSNY
ncbi:MAG: hypothetical protein M3P08_07060 [Thermoproteota archaeon]|nr:hypothetical protein [Thermoproteota archaeon]